MSLRVMIPTNESPSTIGTDPIRVALMTAAALTSVLWLLSEIAGWLITDPTVTSAR